MIEVKKNALIALCGPIGYMVPVLLDPSKLAWYDAIGVPVIYGILFGLYCGLDWAVERVWQKRNGTNA